MSAQPGSARAQVVVRPRPRPYTHAEANAIRRAYRDGRLTPPAKVHPYYRPGTFTPQCDYCGATTMHRCLGAIYEWSRQPRVRVVHDGKHRVELCVLRDVRCRFGSRGSCRLCPFRARRDAA